MKKFKPLLVVLICILLFSIVGCNKTLDNVATNDEEFIKNFEKIINDSLKEQEYLWNDFEKYSAYTQEDYKSEMVDVLNLEKNLVEGNKEAIKNKELRNIVDQYIEGINKQIEAINTQEEKYSYYCEDEANKLRKQSLSLMIEKYDIKINENNKKRYDEILENVIKKENKPQSFVDKLASEARLEEINDSFGDIKFLALFENTSNLCFKNVTYKVEYKNRNGNIVSYDYISINNFTPGDIKKIKLTPYENEVVNVNLITDWYETK